MVVGTHPKRTARPPPAEGLRTASVMQASRAIITPSSRILRLGT